MKISAISAAARLPVSASTVANSRNSLVFRAVFEQRRVYQQVDRRSPRPRAQGISRQRPPIAVLERVARLIGVYARIGERRDRAGRGGHIFDRQAEGPAGAQRRRVQARCDRHRRPALLGCQLRVVCRPRREAVASDAAIRVTESDPRLDTKLFNVIELSVSHGLAASLKQLREKCGQSAQAPYVDGAFQAISPTPRLRRARTALGWAPTIKGGCPCVASCLPPASCSSGSFASRPR